MKTLMGFLEALILMLVIHHETTAQDVLSLHPLFAESDAVLEPAVEGRWSFEIFGIDTLLLEKVGDNFYHLRLPARSIRSWGEAVFTRVGDLLMMDLLPIMPESIGDIRKNLIQAHSCYRVTIDVDTMRLAGISYQWFYDHIVAKKSEIGYSWSSTTPLLTMPTDELRKFIAEDQHERGFFEKDLTLHRIVRERLPDHPAVRLQQAKVVDKKPDSAPLLQHCIPEFPIKDGWLGGDGDISISLGALQTLWIFGDTFVGEKNQKARAGSKMVSNTAALTTCQSNGRTTIQYFWRNPYTDHPEPFFSSMTNRYKYWPCAAFTSGDNLYVPLLKIGPKPGASPDDIFNFKGVGMSLAKVAGPNSTTPDQWDVQLFPWSHIFDPDLWGCSAVDGGYLYIFAKGKNNAVSLFRIPLEIVESPGNRMEYYGNDEKWKAGEPSDVRKILFTGGAGNSVSYYRDVGQWIMVFGPGFLTNKIRIRTAPALVGPWSEEKIIYQCPEQTPGSKTYDKDKFCYLGREHNQFYSREKRTLLITYDCNSADFSKLVSSPDVYIPRVLEIPIPQ